MLAWLNAAGCQKLIGDGSAPCPSSRAIPPCASMCAAALAQWNAAHRGSSERIARALLLPDAPSIDANEITDKGYINQRLALERRKADVARLFAAKPDADVIVVTPISTITQERGLRWATASRSFLLLRC